MGSGAKPSVRRNDFVADHEQGYVQDPAQQEMQLVGFRIANIGGRASLVVGSSYYDIAEASGGALSADPMQVLGSPDQLHSLTALVADRSPTGKVGDVEFGPPVPRPQKSFGVGLNYQAHAEEGGMEVPDAPLVFTKFPSCIVGPTATVELRSDACDYEGELVVVIGPGGKDIAIDDAWNHVVGMTIGQDISDRAAQFASKPPHFDLGKSFDTFGPTGPMLVSLDELGDPDELRITTMINDEIRQDDTTANMIFKVPTLIAYLSRITTLQTGDLIFTGTPEGIGATQGKFLADGDMVTTTIEGIGTMTNPCVRSSDHGTNALLQDA